ncbi:MAG: lyase family protein, partial [Brachymonas sp.]|nr:lyase family protein [Brachymonas sp.]
MSTRTEHDTMGNVEVPSDAYWGAQTQRSRDNFKIGGETLPKPLIAAMALIKKAAAQTNAGLGRIKAEQAELITRAADDVLAGKLDGQFPLVVWQTGSGTQSNMNMNEVLANRANELAGTGLAAYQPVHPNDHVNHAQSTNDSFPTAIHVASAIEINRLLIPAVKALRDTLDQKAKAFESIVKIGRTHLQDATPLTLGQEFSGYVSQLDHGLVRLQDALKGLYELPLGGTAVGTGLNS